MILSFIFYCQISNMPQNSETLLRSEGNTNTHMSSAAAFDGKRVVKMMGEDSENCQMWFVV